jgi:hypothetical protein
MKLRLNTFIKPAASTVVAMVCWGYTARATTMNFDGGKITSDGSGNITDTGNTSVSGSISAGSGITDTGKVIINGDLDVTGSFTNSAVDGRFSFIATNSPSLNLATKDGVGQCFVNFYTYSLFGNFGGGGLETDSPAGQIGFADHGNFTGEVTFAFNNSGDKFNVGMTPLMAVGSAGFSQASGEVGGVAIGSDWLGTLFSMPNNGLVVEGNVGVGTQTPAHAVDVAGDINFTGSLLNNGDGVILPDSGGHGGTTLMLRASNNGTPMYLHVTSGGVATFTTSP